MKGMDALRKVDKMNGISLNSFYGNAGLFSNTILNKNSSQIYGMGVKVQEAETDNKNKSIQRSGDNDTYEHNSMLIQVQNKNEEESQGKDWVMLGRLGFASYDETKLNMSPVFAELDLDGVSKGVKLTDRAKKLLEELKEEYKNVDFTVASLSTNAEKTYYEGLSNRQKDYSILIDAEVLERDADYAGGRTSMKFQLDQMFGREGKVEKGLTYDTDFDVVASWNEEQSKEEMLQQGEQVVAKNQNETKGLYFQIDKTGENDYVVSLLKDMINEEDDKKTLGELQQERMEQKREEVHKQGEADESGKVALIV